MKHYFEEFIQAGEIDFSENELRLINQKTTIVKIVKYLKEQNPFIKSKINIMSYDFDSDFNLSVSYQIS